MLMLTNSEASRRFHDVRCRLDPVAGRGITRKFQRGSNLEAFLRFRVPVAEELGITKREAECKGADSFVQRAHSAISGARTPGRGSEDLRSGGSSC